MSAKISKELIDQCADYLIKQRNFRKARNVLLLPHSCREEVSQELVEYAAKRGIFFKFDTAHPTLLPFGDADSYTLKADYMRPGKPPKQSLWQRLVWKVFGWRGRTDYVFSENAIERYKP